ncbi:hypothetical protein [Paenibacillus sp. GCM10027626]|uniref:hypothetical protein n=1 Tax=Paenibacillus sp. GCM10027626 TaxID=3273411 RepID=UPI00364163FA
MSFNSMNFSYDGIRNDVMGVSLISMSSGFIEKSFFGDREIISASVPGNHTPYIYGERIQPFRIKLQLSPLDGCWTSELKSKIARWLNNGKFNEFYSTDDINRRYFVTYVGSPALFTTALNQGYIEVEFSNIDCYVRSPVMEKIYHNTTGAIEVEITNLGDTTIFPNLHIHKVGTGKIEIRNRSNGNSLSSINGLLDKELLYINGKEKYIESSISNTYRYKDFNGNYPSLVYGVNRIQINGACKIKFDYRYEFLSQ